VIDHGSYLMKAGFAHLNAPSALVPALVGRPHHSGPLVKVNFFLSIIENHSHFVMLTNMSFDFFVLSHSHTHSRSHF
jgi:actin-related protein